MTPLRDDRKFSFQDEINEPSLKKHNTERNVEKTTEQPISSAYKTKKNISDSYNIDPSKKPQQTIKTFFSDKNNAEQDKQKDPSTDSLLPLPVQQYYYIVDQKEKEQKKKPRSKKKNNKIGNDLDEKLPSIDMKGLEESLHRIDFTAKDLSGILDLIKLSTKPWIPEDIVDLGRSMCSDIDIMTREQDENWLRTKHAYERDCISGQDCEGRNLIPNKEGHTLVECLSIKDQEEYMKTRNYPDTRRPCLACIRYQIAFYCINIRAECDNLHTDALLSKIGNIVDQPGEYILSQCIMTYASEYQGLPAPVLLHCRKYYKQEMDDDGIVHYRQKGYLKPEELNESVRVSTISSVIKTDQLFQ